MTQENALPLGDTPADDARSIVDRARSPRRLSMTLQRIPCRIRTVLKPPKMAEQICDNFRNRRIVVSYTKIKNCEQSCESWVLLLEFNRYG